MSALTNTTRLLRLGVRRDRRLIGIWVAVVTALTGAIAGSVVGLYTTEQDRIAAATFSASNVVTRVFDGPAAGTEPGSLVLMEGAWLLAVLCGLACAQVVVRHTRGDEEHGRAELIGAGAVGRGARLIAAAGVATLLALLLGIGVTAALLVAGLPVAGSVLAAGTLVGNGLVFAAVAGVAAQLATTARAANGIVAAALGAAFLARAVGDALGTVSDDGVRVVSAWPSWLSPIGWVHQAQAYADPRWWVLGLHLGLTALLVLVAARLAAGRDLGAGLLPQRPGPARGGRLLRTPLGLAVRLQRGMVLAWVVALTVVGTAFGFVGDSADELLGLSDELAAAVEALGDGGGPVELFLAFTVGLLSLAAAGAGVQAVLRARQEELGGHAEAVLATATARGRWFGAHLLVAGVGTSLVLLGLGLGGLVGFGVVTGDWSLGVEGMLLASLVRIPAALVLIALVAVFVAWVPRAAAALGWAAFALSVVFGQLGALFELPQAVLNLSPFTHAPNVPIDPITATPMLTMLAVAAALGALALVRFRQRDLVLVS
ncbi:MAG: hypothetical protein JJT89_17255 [Nitriliruptoraceae bacterium]|nr:hypothetical protein [Nitriliruptoraceae bacterium]